MHPDFTKIVETITRFGYLWSFVSNGQRTDRYLPVMKKYKDNFNNVNLSIDSSIPEIHDAIRRKKGAYQKAIDSAKTYINNGFPVVIKTSLNKMNKSNVEAIVEHAQILGATGVVFGGTIPTQWNRHLVLSEIESKELFDEIESRSKDATIRVETSSSLFTKGGIYFCNNLSLYHLSINQNGEVTFCCDIRPNVAVLGSLRTNPLTELIKRRLEYSTALQQYRVDMINTGNLEELFDSCAFVIPIALTFSQGFRRRRGWVCRGFP